TASISGMVTGATGSMALVRIWKSSAAAPTQKDLSTGNEVQVGALPTIYMTGIATPFTFPSIPLTPNAANYFVLTVSDQYGNNESFPVRAPAIPQGPAPATGGAYTATITPPAAPITIYPPQTTASVSGAATGQAGSMALIRVWKSSAAAPNQKDMSTG